MAEARIETIMGSTEEATRRTAGRCRSGGVPLPWGMVGAWSRGPERLPDPAGKGPLNGLSSGSRVRSSAAFGADVSVDGVGGATGSPGVGVPTAERDVPRPVLR